jgi:V8-like Glu-specific endopeptidase
MNLASETEHMSVVTSIEEELLVGPWFRFSNPGFFSAINLATSLGTALDVVEEAIQRLLARQLLVVEEHAELGVLYAPTEILEAARQARLRARKMRPACVLAQAQYDPVDLVLGAAVSPSIWNRRPHHGFLAGQPRISWVEVAAALCEHPEHVLRDTVERLASKGQVRWTEKNIRGRQFEALEATAAGTLSYRQIAQPRLGLADDEAMLDERLDRKSREDAIVVLESDQNQGSAFAIGDGLFLTCHHCLEDGTKLFAHRTTLARHKIAVVFDDAAHDVALIRTDEYAPIPLPVEFWPAAYSDWAEAVAIGFPKFNPGDSHQTVSLKATGTRRFRGVQLVLVTGGILAGMSGCPVLNRRGCVIGMAMRGGDSRDEGERNEFQGFLGGEHIREFIASAGQPHLL